jgi:hypothetical protein
MKKILFIATGILFSMSAMSAEMDTTKITLKNKTILIIGDDTSDIILSDTNSYSFKSKRSIRDSHWAGFDLGVNGLLTSSGSTTLDPKDAFLDLNYAKSVVVNLNPFEKYIPIKGDRFGILTGLGFQFNSYDLKTNNRLFTTVATDSTNSQISSFRDTVNMASVSKNKFKATYLTVPILLEYNDGKLASKGFHFAAGMVFGYKIGSKNKMKYTTPSGDNRKDKYRDDFNLNPFSMALTTRFGIGWVNLFATYNITTLFEKNKGPELYPFTVGVTLLDF